MTARFDRQHQPGLTFAEKTGEVIVYDTGHREIARFTLAGAEDFAERLEMWTRHGRDAMRVIPSRPSVPVDGEQETGQ